MKSFQRLGVGAMMVAIAAGSYFAGSQSNSQPVTSMPPVAVATAEAARLIVPKVLPPSSEFMPAVDNPTGVLLGEVKVPVDLLKGPTPTPAPGVIIPEIAKK